MRWSRQPRIIKNRGILGHLYQGNILVLRYSSESSELPNSGTKSHYSLLLDGVFQIESNFRRSQTFFSQLSTDWYKMVMISSRIGCW